MIDDLKLTLSIAALKDVYKGTLTITKIDQIRRLEGKFGPYSLMDIEVTINDGTEEFKHSLTEKDRELIINKLNRDSDKWIGAKLHYKVISKEKKGDIITLVDVTPQETINIRVLP